MKGSIAMLARNQLAGDGEYHDFTSDASLASHAAIAARISSM